MQYLKIPQERIPILIGEKGSVKKEIEARTKTRIHIEDISVSIESIESNYMDEITAKNIVQAIGRGFNPETALMLSSDEDYTFEIIHLSDYANTPNAFERIRGRVIGEGGRTKKTIEELSNTYLAVYGKTISLIGSFDDVALAKEAVLMLVEGARHATVYRFLEREKAKEKTSYGMKHF